MKKFIKCFTVVLAVVLGIINGLTSVLASGLPDKFSVVEGENFHINNTFPALEAYHESEKVVAASVTAGNSYNVDLKLLGVVPVKKVTVDVVSRKYVVPCGTPFGIKMFTDGVVVIGMSAVDLSEGMINPAKEAGLKIGDVITSINGISVSTNEDVASLVESCNGQEMKFIVRRKNMSFDMEITPVKSISESKYKLGAWVRDSSAGVGTMTFYDTESMVFGGLGHAICDVDTGEILPLMSGEVVPVTIKTAHKGIPGVPGELSGIFKKNANMGMLTQNGETGVYGKLNTRPVVGKEVEVAMKQQVTEGPAKILSTIEGEKPEYYDIMIEKVNYKDDSPTKNMVIIVTDEKLLSLTGGIVQGMSGSPIIQNDRLVGAVTHVFVNDPTHGYGIFAENMLKTAQSAKEEIENAA